MRTRMHGDDQVDSDESLVQRLLAEQFPQWAMFPITPVESDGTDNAIYRVGDELVVRLPLIHWAVHQVELEHTWLPRLAPHLRLAVPEPVAKGVPGHGYPYPWAVNRWIHGENAHPDRISDLRQAATDLAGFVRDMQAIDLPDAPMSPRAAPLSSRDQTIRGAINQLRHQYDADALFTIWEEALAAPPWDREPVWVHADLSDGNILVRDDRIHAVIDFSAMGLGEPANDLEPAWGMLSGESRELYRTAVGVDDAAWARGRGWAVTAAVGITYYEHTNPGIVARCRRTLAAVLAQP